MTNCGFFRKKRAFFGKNYGVFFGKMCVRSLKITFDFVYFAFLSNTVNSTIHCAGPRSSYMNSLAPMRSRSSTMDSHPPPTTTEQAEYRPMTHISEHREPSNLDLRDSATEFQEKKEESRKVSDYIPKWFSKFEVVWFDGNYRYLLLPL